MQGAVKPPLVPLNLPNIASNNYSIKYILTFPTKDGFSSFYRCVPLAKTFSQTPTLMPHV